MQNGSIPPNPYVSASSDATVVSAATNGTTRHTAASAGWVYDAASGSIWGATTDSSTY